MPADHLRRITTAEYQFALSIFQREFPAKDELYISNRTGLGDRPYVRPTADGDIYMYMGKFADELLLNRHNRALFAHELTHAWQIEHYGLLWYGKQALDAQVVAPLQGVNPYHYTCDPHKTLGDYKSEQQGDVVKNYVLGEDCERKVVERTLFSKTWRLLTGSAAVDVAVDSDGTRYMVNRGGSIYRYGEDDWRQLSGSDGRAIAANGGNVMLVNTSGLIYQRQGNSWKQLPGSDAVDIAVAADGSAFMVNSAGKIYKYHGSSGWKQIPGSDAARISAGAGQVWLVNRAGKIYRYRSDGWTQMSGSDGRDITVAGDGNVFLTNDEGAIYERAGDAWNKLDGSDGAAVAANNGDLVMVNTKGRLYFRAYS